VQSLSGHSSAVESVTFDSAEALVVAGAASGTIKLWDLEEAKSKLSYLTKDMPEMECGCSDVLVSFSIIECLMKIDGCVAFQLFGHSLVIGPIVYQWISIHLGNFSHLAPWIQT